MPTTYPTSSLDQFYAELTNDVESSIGTTTTSIPSPSDSADSRTTDRDSTSTEDSK